jgi:hypothetical protein
MNAPSLSSGCEIAPFLFAIPVERAFPKTHNPSTHIQFYAPQTKILEGWTKDEMRIFDGVFNDS